MEQEGLFQYRPPGRETPLAERMRPRTLAEFVGQRHVLAPGKKVERLLRHRRLQSLIFWGPPGCGKTTLAGLLARELGAHLVSLSAVTAGVKEVRGAVEIARQQWAMSQRRTILFLDEIHRFNKAQQDLLLPHVESGLLTLIGATTENPSFEVIPPLLSRAPVVVLEPLQEEDLRQIIRRALVDRERGLGAEGVEIDEEAIQALIAAAHGDARLALNGLETAVLTTVASEDGRCRITKEVVADAVLKKALLYDKGGEEHYNLISALHKSLRGSDPDGALYWLARMLAAGEDPRYLARRMVRFAAEDVGLADPRALMVAVAAQQGFDLVGRPEGDLILAQAAVYLATAPKSNALYVAYNKVNAEVEAKGALPVPLRLRNAPTRLMEALGYGRGYRYPHDYPEAHVAETYLPELLAGTVFYEPSTRGYEADIKERLDRWRQQAAGALGDRAEHRRKRTD